MLHLVTWFERVQESWSNPAAALESLRERRKEGNAVSLVDS
jgi:hypothetical protein